MVSGKNATGSIIWLHAVDPVCLIVLSYGLMLFLYTDLQDMQMSTVFHVYIVKSCNTFRHGSYNAYKLWAVVSTCPIRQYNTVSYRTTLHLGVMFSHFRQFVIPLSIISLFSSNVCGGKLIWITQAKNIMTICCYMYVWS